MTNNRNYGLDLLKIICMFFICVHHLLFHGSNIINNRVLLINYIVYNGLFVFPIITGYVSAKSSFKAKRIIELWIQTVFYTIIISLLFFVVSKGQIKQDGIAVITPVTSKTYWYLTSHIKLLIVMPIINNLLNKIKNKNILYIIGLVALTVLIKQNRNFYDNFLAFVLLYVFGIILKRVELKASSTITTFCSIAYFLGIYIYYTDIFKGSFQVPLNLISALSLVVMFSNIKLSEKTTIKIKFLVPLVFGTYLIHDNPLIRNYVISRTVFISNYQGIVFVLVLISTSFVVYLSCLVIEFCRTKLFNFLKINDYITRVSTIIDNRFGYAFKNIF